MYNEQSLTFILYLLNNLLIALPILYCFFQLKKIVFSLSNNTFFSFETAHRFRNIGYGIMFLSCKVIIDIINLCNVPLMTSSGSSSKTIYINQLKGDPLDILLTIRSPIVILFSTIILGFIFILISKTIKQATIMKNEIDQTV
ncbi:MAG: DUF2975 domain-containing protein [Vallitalea sp.]|nr:DUF2975 domain-containing protein [Vallitalea sp.]